MTRQAMFRPNGTLTDVPTKLGENPQLERQLDLLQYPVDTANLARLEEEKEDDSILTGLAQTLANHTGKPIAIEPAGIRAEPRPLVNPHATALTQDKQLRAQQRHDKSPGLSEANDYIKRIRNQRKKLYARAYLGHLLGKRSEPDHNGYALGYMAAQSVRIHLGGLIS